ncbi:DUF1918 domain-containing protein [Embleya sp. NPDC005971]|uniref:DUF1918 domain-containing protein n=1 Tax=Embleya sp. NPDC005971 TaxID=3156724 RepID=UPI0033DB6843
MPANVGDRIRMGSRTAEIVEVLGPRGNPPYTVRFDDGTEKTVFPLPDEVDVVEEFPSYVVLK